MTDTVNADTKVAYAYGTLFVFEISRVIAHWSPSSNLLPTWEAGPFLTFEAIDCETRELPLNEVPEAWRALKEGDMVSGWFWEFPGGDPQGPFGPFLTQAEAEADGREHADIWGHKIFTVVAGADDHDAA